MCIRDRIGSAPGANGVVWISSQLAPLTVAPPFIAMKIEMTTVEQGRNADVVCKLEQLRPFEGKAKVGLYGLPPAVVAEPAEKEITKDDKEVTFRVKIAANSPVGQHKSIFAQVLIPGDGDTMAHSVGGGGIMRIDSPPPPKKNAPLAKPGEAPKPGEPAKRLTRLEQLRLEAEEKAKEGNK